MTESAEEIDEERQRKIERMARAREVRAANAIARAREAEERERADDQRRLKETEARLPSLNREYAQLLQTVCKRDSIDEIQWRRLDQLQSTILNSVNLIRKLQPKEPNCISIKQTRK